MSKIIKQQLQQHEAAEELLWGSDRSLRRDEVEFCLEHWDHFKAHRVLESG